MKSRFIVRMGIAALFITSLGSCKKEQPAIPWELKFHEDFLEDTLNTRTWRTAYPWNSFNHSQFYDAQDLSVENGILTITARRKDTVALAVPYKGADEIIFDGKKNKRTFQYTSGMIYLNKAYLYGKFEIRCRIPDGKGVWPAFWVYGPCGQEIDIFEFDCEFTDEIHTARHRKLYCADDRDLHLPATFTASEGLHNAFHTYAVEWTKNRIAWYFDENLIREDIKFNDVVYSQAFPDSALNVIVNLAVGGTFTESAPSENPDFPETMEVDYIKIYQ